MFLPLGAWSVGGLVGSVCLVKPSMFGAIIKNQNIKEKIKVGVPGGVVLDLNGFVALQ